MLLTRNVTASTRSPSDAAANVWTVGASDDAASLLAAAVRAACVPVSVDLACAHAEALLFQKNDDRERLQAARDVLEAALEREALRRANRPFCNRRTCGQATSHASAHGRFFLASIK